MQMTVPFIGMPSWFRIVLSPSGLSQYSQANADSMLSSCVQKAPEKDIDRSIKNVEQFKLT